MKHIGLRIAAAIVFLFCNNRISAQTDGYLSARAASQGETLRFYISTPLPQFDLKIYKLGLFKKEVLTLTNLPGGIQSTDDSAFINGCNWRVTKEFTIPLTWSSGIYEADIPSADTIKKLIFIVREKYLGKHSKTLVCLTENTWQAYNNWGGRSLYDFNSYSQTRSLKISFNRPLSDTTADYYFRWTNILVKWLEAHHFDAEFCVNSDLDRDANFLSHYKTYVTVGHDEYWSRPERNQIENFVNNGGRFICLSGNTCWWQVRFEDSLRTLVCYRDIASDPMYPQQDSIVTSVWARSPINEPPNPFLGVSFEHGGFINDDGIFPQYDGYGGYTVFNSNHWIYNGTGVKDGDIIGLDDAIAGYESDGALFDWDRGFLIPTGEDKTPVNFSILGISLAASAGKLPSGHATMGYFPTANGGAVFNGGSTDWVRGLDVDDSVQSQMLFNIFWRFTYGFDMPPEIKSFSPVRVTQDSINHEWVNLNRQSIPLSLNSTDTFSIHAVNPSGKKLFYSWSVAGKVIGYDSVFILTPQMKSAYPKAYLVEGSAISGYDRASVSWAMLDTTLRIVSIPLALQCKIHSYYSYQAIAASLVDEHPQYKMIYGPSWMKLNSKGLLSGFVSSSAGNETIILRASDEQGNSDLQTFTLRVLDSLSDVGVMSVHETSLQCYPNPVREEAVLLLALEKSEHVEMEIRNIEGMLVRTFSPDEFSEGSHKILWDRKDEEGKPVSSGVYFCHAKILDGSGSVATLMVKVILL